MPPSSPSWFCNKCINNEVRVRFQACILSKIFLRRTSWASWKVCLDNASRMNKTGFSTPCYKWQASFDKISKISVLSIKSAVVERPSPSVIEMRISYLELSSVIICSSSQNSILVKLTFEGVWYFKMSWVFYDEMHASSSFITVHF